MTGLLLSALLTTCSPLRPEPEAFGWSVFDAVERSLCYPIVRLVDRVRMYVRR